jgi:hypothetical protein
MICGNGYGLKCFPLRKALKWCFFIFKKLFLRSAHQNNLKTYIKYINKIFLKKKLKNMISRALFFWVLQYLSYSFLYFLTLSRIKVTMSILIDWTQWQLPSKFMARLDASFQLKINKISMLIVSFVCKKVLSSSLYILCVYWLNFFKNNLM